MPLYEHDSDRRIPPPWEVDRQMMAGPSSLGLDAQMSRIHGSETWNEWGTKRPRNIEEETPPDRVRVTDFAVPFSGSNANTRSRGSSERGKQSRGSGRRGTMDSEQSKGSSRGSQRGSGRGSRRSKESERGNTRNLYGGLHVPGVKISPLEGGMGLWFLFAVCSAY